MTKDVDLDRERRSKNEGTPPFRYWVDKSKVGYGELASEVREL